MRLVKTPTGGDTTAREMTAMQAIFSAMKYRLIRLRRKLPYIVWYNDELDVTVTLSQDKLIVGEDLDDALHQLYSGAFFDIEKIFGEMGIGFDKGMGCDGRDWEWDWSLKGPISVRFRSRATKPEIRMERKKPILSVVG